MLKFVFEKIDVDKSNFFCFKFTKFFNFIIMV